MDMQSLVNCTMHKIHDKRAPSTEYELWHQDYEAHDHAVQQCVYQALKNNEYNWSFPYDISCD